MDITSLRCVCVCITVVVAVWYIKTSSSLLSTLYIVPVPAKHGDMGMGMGEKGMWESVVRYIKWGKREGEGVGPTEQPKLSWVTKTAYGREYTTPLYNPEEKQKSEKEKERVHAMQRQKCSRSVFAVFAVFVTGKGVCQVTTFWSAGFDPNRNNLGDGRREANTA